MCECELLVDQDQWRSWGGRMEQPPRTQIARGGKTKGKMNTLNLCDFLRPPNFKFLSKIKGNPAQDVIARLGRQKTVQRH